MKGHLYVIRPDGFVSCKPLDHTPDWREIKAGLDGGFLELVPYWNTFRGERCVAFCDEHGKDKNLRFNHTANAEWQIAVGRRITEDFLVGPIVIICGDDELLKEL
jgi:hypothetical protein